MEKDCLNLTLGDCLHLTLDKLLLNLHNSTELQV